MLNRTDVERIIEIMLKDLSINVTNMNDVTSPNERKIELRYKDEVISYDYFSIEQRDD